MKKNLLFLLMLICSMSLFTACNDDDDNGKGEETPLAQQIAGTYSGNLEVSLDGTDLGTSKQHIYVKDAGNVVSVELKDFSIQLEADKDPFNVEDITFSNVPVEDVEGIVQFKETKVTINHATLGELQATLVGTEVSNKIDLNITVYASTLKKNIKVLFTGDKINSEPKDFAGEIASWYSREDLKLTGIEIDPELLQSSVKGISIVRAGYNKIGIASTVFYFVGDQGKYLEIKSMDIQKTQNGIELLEATAVSKYDKKVSFIVSGTIVDNKLTLNVTMSDGTDTAEYVFIGSYKHTDAAIDKMTINSDVVTVQPEIGDVDSNKASIVFYVKAGTSQDKLSLVPEFEISSGATLYYKDKVYVKGTAIDFSTEQDFKVTAESGQTYVVYTVKTAVLQDNFSFATNFDGEWERVDFSDKVSYDEPGAGWATSNGGVAYIKGIFPKLYAPEAPNAVIWSDEGKTGKAACLETLDTKGQAGFGGFIPAIPKVTSGSVFTGVFEVNIGNTLKSTKFGYPCFKKPVAFKGSYKYSAGKVYYVCADPVKANEVKEDATQKDSPAMNAVLYEVDTYAFDILDGTNLLTSDKIVAIASVDGKEQAEYKDFTVDFKFKEGKSFDSSKKYKLTIVCSSSKDGDKFSGAPGSVLYVDNLEVTF